MRLCETPCPIAVSDTALSHPCAKITVASDGYNLVNPSCRTPQEAAVETPGMSLLCLVILVFSSLWYFLFLLKVLEGHNISFVVCQISSRSDSRVPASKLVKESTCCI